MSNSSYKYCAVRYMYNKALSDKNKAEASLEILLEHPAGIGDHSTEDLYKTLDEALDILVDARDRIETLESVYPKITKEQQFGHTGKPHQGGALISPDKPF